MRLFKHSPVDWRGPLTNCWCGYKYDPHEYLAYGLYMCHLAGHMIEGIRCKLLGPE